jgi:hypothetical protein
MKVPLFFGAQLRPPNESYQRPRLTRFLMSRSDPFQSWNGVGFLSSRRNSLFF